MLPGANGGGIADLKRLVGGEGADDIGDEAIGGPVATADDIAGAGRCDRGMVLCVVRGIEEGIASGTGDDLGAGL